MNNTTLEKIYKIAKDVREGICFEFGSDILDGLCYYTSEQLKKELGLEGFKSKLIAGIFEVDEVDQEFVDFMGGELDEELYKQSHYWLELKGFIIDITADQFNMYLNKNKAMSQIVIGTYRNLPNYKKG